MRGEIYSIYRFAFRFIHKPTLPAETGNSRELAGKGRYGLLVVGP